MAAGIYKIAELKGKVSQFLIGGIQGTHISV